MEKIKSDITALFNISYRNMRVFLKDKMTVFFSVLSPLIVLLLYILFLGDVQVDGMRETLPQTVGDGAIRTVADCWLIAGVLAVACLTVAASAATSMVSDRQNRILDDFNSSPCPSYIIGVGYILSCFALTFIITFVIMALSFIYLAATGSFVMSAGEVFEIIGIMLLSALSSTIFMSLLVGLFKTEAAAGGFMGILSAVSGFIIGAYMPLSMFPLGIQYFCAIIPASYSAMLMRNVLLAAPVENLAALGVPPQGLEAINGSFSVNLNAFGLTVSKTAAYLILFGSVLLFLAISVAVKKLKKKV